MRSMLALATLAALATGCVSQSKYNELSSEAENLDNRLKEEKGAREALEAKVKDFEEKLAALERDKEALTSRLTTSESRLTASAAERYALEQKNLELSALNDELSEAKEALEKKSSEYENLAQSLKQEISDGKIQLSELQGRMTVQLKDKILFASGSTRVNKEGQDALVKIAQALKSVPGRIIRVEGHTDDVPMPKDGPFPSNWELSLARAMAVVRALQDSGVDPTVLSAGGYGQYQPIAPNDSDKNRSLNRRIEIVLAPKVGGR
jgi:chemotaxis protein MotB